MEHIWSPWRMKYISRQKMPRGCIFCNALKKEDGVDNLIVIRSELAFVILNRYPYTSGHLMVVPNIHASTMEDLDSKSLSEVMELIRQSITAINTVYKPEGYNIGANLGAVAGAGIANHIHFHVVPRWGGDTNFMTSISATRVLPDDLCDTYRRLKEVWPNG
jgi:ATP adenylyltransferase